MHIQFLILTRSQNKLDYVQLSRNWYIHYVYLSWNWYIHYVYLSRNLHIHYVQIRPSKHKTFDLCCKNILPLFILSFDTHIYLHKHFSQFFRCFVVQSAKGQASSLLFLPQSLMKLPPRQKWLPVDRNLRTNISEWHLNPLLMFLGDYLCLGPPPPPAVIMTARNFLQLPFSFKPCGLQLPFRNCRRFIYFTGALNILQIFRVASSWYCTRVLWHFGSFQQTYQRQCTPKLDSWYVPLTASCYLISLGGRREGGWGCR